MIIGLVVKYNYKLIYILWVK